MDPYEQLDLMSPTLEQLVRGTRASQLGDPTPCDKFAVRDLLDHLVGGLTTFGALFRGEAPPDLDGRDVVGDDHAAAFSAALAAFDEASRAPGAMDRTIAAPFGEVPAPVFLRFLAFDGLVHSWDLATATGQSFNPPDDLVTDVEAFARTAVAPEMRDGDTFAREVTPPAGASLIERLVAFSGRQP